MADQQLTPFGSALSGALGSIFANATVYPLDTVKTRLQALPTDERPGQDASPVEDLTEKVKRAAKQHDVKAVPRTLIHRLRRWEMLNMLLRIIKTEGLAGVFKGFSANMINTFSQQFAYFFFHTSLRSALMARLGLPSLSTAQELALGALAGAFAQIFTIPVSVIALRQQISNSKSSKSLLQVGREIVHENGWTGLWTGLKPGLVLTVNPAITYGVFERVKGVVLARPGRAPAQLGRLTVGESFWIGVASKTLATVVTYPYIFAKVRLQAKSTRPPTGSTQQPTSASTTNTTTPKETKETLGASPPSSTHGSQSEGLEESYAEIASHPAAENAPIIPDSEVGKHQFEPQPYKHVDVELGPQVFPSQNPSGSGSASERAREGVNVNRLGQVGKGGKEGQGAIALLMKVYKERGLGGWYQGLGAQIIKAVLCQGILFVSKDQFESYTILLLALIARLRARVNLRLPVSR